jgi:hypothetical protein
MILTFLSILSATIAELFAEKNNAMPNMFSQKLVVHPQDPCPITCISSHKSQKDARKESLLEFITSLNLIERFGLTPQTDDNVVVDEVDVSNRVDNQSPTNGGASHPCLWYVRDGYPLWPLLAPPFLQSLVIECSRKLSNTLCPSLVSLSINACLMLVRTLSDVACLREM